MQYSMHFFAAITLCFAESAKLFHRKDDNNQSGLCRCVPTNLCADNDAAVNGQGLLDVRFQTDVCQNYFEVCCENPIEKIENHPEQSIVKECGHRKVLGVTARITSNSQNAQFGELPWSIVILLRDAKGTERNMYRCGGSLIHPQVVLTAAHCVYGVNPQLFTVRAGEWNTKSQDEPIPHQDRMVQETVTHPLFHGGSLKNDVSLLFLADPVILTDNIGLICLPPSNLTLEQGSCVASGWGKDAFKRGKHSSIMKKVDLPLVTRENCTMALRKTRLGNFYNLHSSFICAGGEKNKDTCKGDGGSSLVCQIPGSKERFFQMGIVSWGIGCGETKTPGVYVNVPLYAEWIDKQMYAKNLDSSVYKY